MPLAAMADIVGPARAAGRGVGAFNVIGIEHAEAIVPAPRRPRAPVVLQISENCVAYHGALDADRARVPGRRGRGRGAGRGAPRPRHRRGPGPGGGRAGPGSVMFDASALPYAENVAATAERRPVVPRAGRLGRGGTRRDRRQGRRALAARARTDPDEAAGYVAATGVDALAVAVGSSHAMLTRDAVLDLDLIARIRPRPSACRWCCTARPACPTRTWPRRSRAGMTKINVATQLNKVFTGAVRESLAADPAVVDPRRYGAAGRDAIAAEVSPAARRV